MYLYVQLIIINTVTVKKSVLLYYKCDIIIVTERKIIGTLTKCIVIFIH